MRQLAFFSFLSVFALLLISSCGGEADTETPAAEATSTPVDKTVTESDDGPWEHIWAVGESQSKNGIDVTIARAGYSTPAKLLPDASAEVLAFRGLDEAKYVFAVVVLIHNRSNQDIDLFPGGIGALLLIGTEQAEPALFASDTGGTILSGATTENQVVFPLTRTDPAKIKSFRYTFADYDFRIDLEQ